jgi:hypothetical protein
MNKRVLSQSSLLMKLYCDQPVYGTNVVCHARGVSVSFLGLMKISSNYLSFTGVRMLEVVRLGAVCTPREKRKGADTEKKKNCPHYLKKVS